EANSVAIPARKLRGPGRVGALHAPSVHTPDVQSVASVHGAPSSQGSHTAPPQSTSVSFPPATPSSHDGARQILLGSSCTTQGQQTQASVVVSKHAVNACERELVVGRNEPRFYTDARAVQRVGAGHGQSGCDRDGRFVLESGSVDRSGLEASWCRAHGGGCHQEHQRSDAGSPAQQPRGVPREFRMGRIICPETRTVSVLHTESPVSQIMNR
ncbi:MAG: hypothetical protein ACI9OJ_005675, partial [Myxococcota bacterium]